MQLVFMFSPFKNATVCNLSINTEIDLVNLSID